jgi:hypothetical protein
LHHAVVERLAPEALELDGVAALRIAGANDVVARLLALGAEQGVDQLVSRLPLVERLDQRLEDRHRAVIGAGVSPGLERMRSGDVPMAEVERLVRVERPVDA